MLSTSWVTELLAGKTRRMQSEKDALCCCQANNVPNMCLRKCMWHSLQDHEHDEYGKHIDESHRQDDIGLSHWLIENFLSPSSSCKRYLNIIAGCWKQLKVEGSMYSYLSSLDNDITVISMTFFSG